MKILISSFLLILSLNTLAVSVFEGCGIYAYKGKVTIKNQKMNLFINEGTKSEMTFYLSVKQEAELAPYLNRQVEGKIQITQLMDGTLSNSFNILDAKRSTIDPLHPLLHSFLNKLEDKKCE
jgi:hypothetical protein